MSGCDSCGSEAPAARMDDTFRRILWVALGVNASMFLAEVVAAYIAGSVSLQADALDFFGDAANYAITLLVLGMGAIPRARAALFKGATMAAFGAWVVGSAVYHAVAGKVPEPLIMGPVAILALLANVTVALLLYRHRNGDSNRQSVWLCSRNDAIGNVAVLLAAAGVFATGSGWPDILVAFAIATLSISAASSVFVHARRELVGAPG